MGGKLGRLSNGSLSENGWLQNMIRLLMLTRTQSEQFKEYAAKVPPSTLKPSDAGAARSSATTSRYAGSWIAASIRPRQHAEASSASPFKELDEYLSSPLAVTDNIILWWGVSV